MAETGLRGRSAQFFILLAGRGFRAPSYPRLALYLENLDRLDLIRLERGLISSGEAVLLVFAEIYGAIHRTELGGAFLRACGPPAKPIA
jgi:hypothetical protein